MTPVGFSGDVDSSSHSGQILYYASALEEIVFHQHAWPLTERGGRGLPLARDRIMCGGGPPADVVIIWNQCGQQVQISQQLSLSLTVLQVYPAAPVWEEYGLQVANYLMIFIDPVHQVDGCGLYRVRVMLSPAV
jgi:hypothetical protein